MSNSLADTAYIVDQLLVGLHQEKDSDSPIIKVLSTGSVVEILNRQGDYTEIRELEDGKTGWIDSSYLMLEQPAKMQVAELHKKINELENQQVVKNLAESEKKLEQLQQNLSSEKLKSGELEATISQHEKKLAHIEAQGGQAKLTELAEKNVQLEEQLITLEKNPESIANTQLTMMQFLRAMADNPVLLIVTFILIMLAFFVGRWWEDRKYRQRHGGFRI